METGTEMPTDEKTPIPEVIQNEELSLKEKMRYTKITIAAISGKDLSQVGDLEAMVGTDILEKEMFNAVHSLPEQLAVELGTIDPEPYIKRANGLRSEIQAAFQETNRKAKEISDKQVQLIYQYLGIIGKVQNRGDSGFLPTLSEEIDSRDGKVFGLDCSLSAWSLNEKLQGVPGLQVDFGYLPGHAVNIVTTADGSNLYVDAQNGFIAKVDLKAVIDEKNPNTDYPIFRIANKQLLSGIMPDGIEARQIRTNGSDYIPPYVGRKESGLGHTLGNMFMLEAEDSPVSQTKTAHRVRAMLEGETIGSKFLTQYVNGEIIKGKTFWETKFADMVEEDHATYISQRQ